MLRQKRGIQYPRELNIVLTAAATASSRAVMEEPADMRKQQ
jgi:hypothetical protein